MVGWVRGRVKVVPWSQGWNWSRNEGLAGLPDSPVGMLAWGLSGSGGWGVKRSLGPKWRPAALTVVESPPLGWKPEPVATPSMVLMGLWLPKMGGAMSVGGGEPEGGV